MRTPVKQLTTGALLSVPQEYDWSAHEYGKDWEYWEAVDCGECDKILIVTSPGEDQHKYLDYESDCRGYVNSNGPMMNYYYPLPYEVRNPERAAKLIADLPLVVVHLMKDEVWALALTGGGMDFSWQICEAFTRLGYLPPIHFADIEDMSEPWTQRTRYILSACERSLAVVRDRSKRGVQRVRELRKRMKERHGERKARGGGG